MKDLKDVNIKNLKEAIKDLNNSGLIKTKIKLVGVTNKALLEGFTAALADLPEDTDVPQGIADFYNDLYADEIVAGTGEETTDDEGEEIIDDGEEVTEDGEATEEEGNLEEEEGTTGEGAPEPTPTVTKKEKAKKTPPVIREKPKVEKKALGVERRATVNPKLSLIKKVTNLLNFSGQHYKKTSYFPLDTETVRILETNVGLYPTEILAAMKHDRKVAKRIEKFTEPVLIREINKIKSAYSYIVGAIQPSKAEGKLRYIMLNLLEGKEVPPEIAHYSTVKVCRRALLAYMEVTGVDYSTMKEVQKDLVKKASEKPGIKPISKPAAKSEPKPAAKPAPETKKKTDIKPAAKPAPAAKPTKKPAPKK